MPSFDIVSELNFQEVDNAVNQAQKEVATRYDFKGSQTTLALETGMISLNSSDEFKMKALLDVLKSKAVKRGLSLKSFQFGGIEPAGGGRVKCEAKLIQGIETEKGRELVKKVKELNLKVQVAIEGEKLRVAGKKRDDLQAVIQSLRGLDFPIPLQFVNFRD